MKPARRAGLLIAGGLLFTLLLAAVFRGPLAGALVLMALHRNFGLEATIGQAGGSVIAGLDLRGVSARGGPGTGPLAFEADHIVVQYSLPALLQGTGAFLDSLELTVEGALIDVDLTLRPTAGRKPAESPTARPALPWLPRFAVRDSRVRLRGPGFSLEAAGLQGAVTRADQGHAQVVELRTDRFSLRHPALREGTISLAITGRSAPGGLSITGASVNGEPVVDRARLTLGERPGELDLDLALRFWRGTAEIRVARRAAGTEVRWDARRVDLQPQLLFTNPALGALRGLLSTKGSVRLDGGDAATLAGTLSLDWSGAQIAGRAVDSVSIRGSAEAGTVLVERAEGRIGVNDIRVNHAKLPAPALIEGRWREVLSQSEGAVSATFGDVPAFLALWGVPTGDVAPPAHRLVLEGSLEKGRLRVERGELAVGGGKARIDAVTADFPPAGRGWGETAFSGAATVDIPNLAELSALLRLPRLSGSLRGGITGSGSFSRPEGRASLSGRGIGVAGRMVGDVEVRLRGSAGRVEIDTLEVRQGGSRFTAEHAGFAPAALAAADRSAFFDSLFGTFTARSTDLPALAALLGMPPETTARIPPKHLLTAAATVRARAIAVTAASFSAAGASVTLRDARVTLPGAGADWVRDTAFEGDLGADVSDLGPIAKIFRLPPLQGSFKAKARVSGSLRAPAARVDASGGGIAIGGRHVGDIIVKAAAEGQRVKIETLEVSRGEDRLRARGSYDREAGTLTDVEADIALADVAPYLDEFARKGMQVSGRLHGTLRAAGPLPGAPLVGEVTLSDGRLGSVQGVSGTVRAEVGLTGTILRPRIGTASLSGELRGETEGSPARASLAATYQPGRLSVGVFELAGPGGLSVKGEGSIPVDFAAEEVLGPGPLSFQAKATIPALGKLASFLPPAYALTGSLDADAAFSGSWKEPAIRVDVRGAKLQTASGNRFAPPGTHTLVGTLTWGADKATAEGFRLESPGLSLSLSGAWSSPPPLPSLLAGRPGAATGTLSLRAALRAPDIGWLRDSVEGLRVLRGSVTGELSIEGPASDPTVTGTLNIARGEIRFGDLPSIDALVVRATILRRVATLEEFGGNLGGSPFTIAGSLDFSRLDDPVVNLRLRGVNALLYRDAGMRVRADSDLTLSGPVSALSLSGEVALTDSLYQKDFSVADLFSKDGTATKRPTPGLAGISFPEPPLRDLRFDVRLTARKPFVIRTPVVQGSARPDLRLTGTGLLPILRGTIRADNARALLPAGTLEFERGTVLFGEGSPVVDFGGRMQSLGYDITAQIEGTIDNPEVTLSSIPVLPEEDLLLFVVTGAPPGSADASGSSAVSRATPLAIYLGRNVLEQLFGGVSRGGAAKLQDRLQVQVGRETTRAGSVTVEARLLLGKSNVGGRRAVYLTSEKDIYDQYNAGLKIVFKFR